MRWAYAVIVIVGCGDNIGPVSATELAKACIKLRACDPVPGDVNGCLLYSKDFLSDASAYRPEQVRCLANAPRDCDRVYACIGALPPVPCAVDATRCDGNREVRCSQGIERSVDCSGGTYHSTAETCILGRCASGRCDATGAYTRTCDGNTLESCSPDGVLIREDCLQYGVACVLDPIGTGASCNPSPTCNEPNGCDGNALTWCVGNERRSLDCSTLLDGGTCSALFGGCAFGERCSDAEPAYCTGDKLTACALGAPVALDCKDLGFTTCREFEYGPEHLGNCVP